MILASGKIATIWSLDQSDYGINVYKLTQNRIQ